MEATAWQVLIVAKDPLARAGLANLLANESSCVVVGQITSETDLLTEVDVYRPDVIIWDLGWDSSLTLEQIDSMRDIELPIVALLPNQAPPPQLWSAGLRGLLSRDVKPEQLLAAVQAAAQGLIVLAPDLTPDLMPGRLLDHELLTEELTRRELEVLQLLAEGLPNKVIARQLNISEHTVKFHVNAILGKLHAQSRTEAVVRATRLGLLLL
jgi:two-component system nitrate/nitrite response regulator NarL